jgi:hypothetical protein
MGAKYLPTNKDMKWNRRFQKQLNRAKLATPKPRVAPPPAAVQTEASPKPAR